MSKEQIKAAADRAEARARGKTAAEEFVEAALSEAEIDAEIIKLAALPIGVYESSRVAAAKRLRMRASILDQLVSAKRTKPKEEGEINFLPHWNVEPWQDPVDGGALLQDLRNHFKRYVVLPKQADVVLALWVLHTWVFDCFDITPYLAITSPTKRCGKTVLMTMLYWLCRRAKKNDHMSKASIYRSVETEQSTLILDEVGWVLDLKDERQGILCGGFELLGHVEICEGEGANIVVRRYRTFGPKAFGLIGKLTPTLMDRSIEILMQRKTKQDKVERLRRGDNAAHVELRQRQLRWASDNRQALSAVTPKLPDGLNDREFDIWEPLFAIAEHVGGEWPKLAHEAAIALSGGDNATEEKGIELLSNISVEAGRVAKDGFSAVTTKTLLAALNGNPEWSWATYNFKSSDKVLTERQLANLLKPFKVFSDKVQTSETGLAQARGYRLKDFEEAFERYLDVSSRPTAFQVSKCPNDDEMGTTSDFSIRPESFLDGSKNSEKSNNDGQMDTWTLRRGEGASERLNGKLVCVHCGAPATDSKPVLKCAVEGEEYLLHRECRDDWLGEK
jgi:hypothetical protein